MPYVLLTFRTSAPTADPLAHVTLSAQSGGWWLPQADSSPGKQTQHVFVLNKQCKHLPTHRLLTSPQTILPDLPSQPTATMQTRPPCAGVTSQSTTGHGGQDTGSVSADDKRTAPEAVMSFFNPVSLEAMKKVSFHFLPNLKVRSQKTEKAPGLRSSAEKPRGCWYQGWG